ncbi:MAG: hypothetical protein ABFD49_11305 [Armatimonadota bacterium]|nr:hypothetical protein [bacterium]
MDWNSFFKTLGSSAVVVAAVGWVARGLFSNILSRDLQKHKNDLEKDIERFKADLRVHCFEHETRFARLHEERVFVIAKLFELVARVDRIIRRLPRYNLSEELYSKLSNAIDELDTYSAEHEVYFDDALCRNLREFIHLAGVISVLSPKEGDIPSHDDGEVTRGIHNLQNTIPPILAEIRKQFRMLIGAGVAGCVVNEETSDDTNN